MSELRQRLQLLAAKMRALATIYEAHAIAAIEPTADSMREAAMAAEYLATSRAEPVEAKLLALWLHRPKPRSPKRRRLK